MGLEEMSLKMFVVHYYDFIDIQLKIQKFRRPQKKLSFTGSWNNLSLATRQATSLESFKG